MVFEGLSRRTAGVAVGAGAGAARAKVARGAAVAVPAAIVGGAMRTKVQGTTQGKKFWCDKIFKMQK